MRAQQLEGIGRIGFGAWQIGDDSCGPVDEASAMHALSAAADAGANTALDAGPLRMARPGREPGTPRFSVVLSRYMNPVSVQWVDWPWPWAWGQVSSGTGSSRLWAVKASTR